MKVNNAIIASCLNLLKEGLKLVEEPHENNLEDTAHDSGLAEFLVKDLEGPEELLIVSQISGIREHINCASAWAITSASAASGPQYH